MKEEAPNIKFIRDIISLSEKKIIELEDFAEHAQSANTYTPRAGTEARDIRMMMYYLDDHNFSRIPPMLFQAIELIKVKIETEVQKWEIGEYNKSDIRSIKANLSQLLLKIQTDDWSNPQPDISEKLSIKEEIQKEINNLSFVALEGDTRPAKEGIYKYEQIVKNPRFFVQFENQLYKSRLIDNNYNFVNQHGNITLLAAIYHQLIRKKYFRDIIPKGKRIKPIDIRKFLNHRYGVEIDKHFRVLQNNRDELKDRIEKHHWIDCLLNCP